MGSLTTPRRVLTSLINAIAATPSAQERRQQAPTPSTTDNVLRDVPASRRPLLMTLHVLYPSLVLPALDLLDRGLVSRVLPSSESENGRGADGQIMDSGSPEAAFYLVRPSASQSRRRFGASTSGTASSRPRIVRLRAWHCSCAAFAFASFPAEAEDAERSEHGNDDTAGASAEWQFGGLGLETGRSSDEAPCCKHLLACLLAERWGALRRYVLEDRIAREEMAAMVYGL